MEKHSATTAKTPLSFETAIHASWAEARCQMNLIWSLWIGFSDFCWRCCDEFLLYAEGRCYVDGNQFSSGCSEKLMYRRSNENSCYFLLLPSDPVSFTLKCAIDKKIQVSFIIVFFILNINWEEESNLSQHLHFSILLRATEAKFSNWMKLPGIISNLTPSFDALQR